MAHLVGRRRFPLVLSVVFIALVAADPTRRVAGAEQPGVELLKAGKSAYSIVLEPSASPSEKHAAEEIAEHFKACTGVDLPIVTGKPPQGGPMIVLGRGPIAKELGVAPSDEELGRQGFLLRTAPPHVVIAGTRGAGALYGARHFLEQALGVRWYSPDVTTTPKQENVTLGEMDQVVRPGFVWRRTSYTWPGGDAEFRSRRGENTGYGKDDCPLGRQYSADYNAHSYFEYIRPNEFFATHPEYFSEINGRRIDGDTQLCLTNPRVLEIVTERMLKWIKGRPYDWQYNFSQMDSYNGCECAKCRAMNEKYGTKGGTQFWFVNALAKRIGKVHPDKLVSTLAYMYTEEPPKGMKMEPNVAVWLCHMMPCCDSHPIATCPRNAEYKRRAEAWSKICSHLSVWHYIVDFAHYYNPFPNFRALAADMKFYQSIGVESVYCEAMERKAGGGEFSLLRGYYITELMENPHADADATVRDFLAGYYGAAAEPIHRYITMLEDKVEKDNIHMHLYCNPGQGYLPDDVLAKAEKMFDEAEAAVAKDPELLERVRVARMPLIYAKTFPRNGYKIEKGTLVFQGPFAAVPEIMGFLERMKRHGFEDIRESYGDPRQMLLMAGFFHMPMPVVTIRNAHLQVDIVPMLGGRALRIIDRKSGKSVTMYNTPQNVLFPFCGGEQSRVGGMFDLSGGPMSQPSIVRQTETSVVLERKLDMGLTMRRILMLAADRPVLTIRSQFTNVRDKTCSTQIASNLNLSLGDIDTVRVRYKDRGGQTVDEDMTEVIAGQREGKPFYRASCPKGEWTFSGNKGLEVTQRFDLQAVDYTRLVAYPPDLGQVDLELLGRRTIVPPGKSAVLRQELEVRATGEAETQGR